MHVVIRVGKYNFKFRIWIDYSFELQRNIKVVLEDQRSLENSISEIRIIVDFPFRSWYLFSLNTYRWWRYDIVWDVKMD